MRSRELIPTFGLALLASCVSARKAPPPFATVTVDHFLGTIHTGTLARVRPEELGEASWFEVAVRYAGAAPATPASPVSARARQVFVEVGSEPLKSRSALALGIVVLEGAAAPAKDSYIGEALHRSDPSWRGTTTVWRTSIATAASGVEDPPRVPWRALELELSLSDDPGAQPELALVLEADGAPREHLVLDPPSRSAEVAWRLFLPAPRWKFPGGGFLLEIRRCEPPAPEEMAGALASAEADLDASSTRAREGVGRLTRDEGFHFESSSALRALEDRGLRRSALVFLAQSSGAVTTGELAIGIERGDLESYLEALRARARGESLAGRDASALGWILESTTLTWLAARAADAEHPASPEMRALLLVRTGELARFPDLVRVAVEESDGLEALERRLLEENRIFLEDADPSARVRAFEWLRERSRAPEEYDPLASLTERRAALARARAAETPVEPSDEKAAPR